MLVIYITIPRIMMGTGIKDHHPTIENGQVNNDSFI